jgi:hypothetical protein
VVYRPLWVALAAVVALAACTPPAVRREDLVKATTSTISATTSTTAPDPLALTLGQRTKTKEGNDVEVTAFVQPVVAGVLEADPGKEFAAAEAQICAGPRGARRVTPESFKIEMPDGSVRGRSYFGPKEPLLADARLEGGACVRGWLNFEVPKGTRPAYVVFQGSSVVRWRAGVR